MEIRTINTNVLNPEREQYILRRLCSCLFAQFLELFQFSDSREKNDTLTWEESMNHSYTILLNGIQKIRMGKSYEVCVFDLRG